MPELPEVETIVQALKPCLVGQAPIKITCFKEKILQAPEPLSQALGRPITNISRKGKLILIWAPPYVWLIHLRMTGQLWWQHKDAPLPRHTHLIVSMNNTDHELRYADVRQFGYWQIVHESKLVNVPFLQKLGPDALNISPSLLQKQLQKKRTSIKTLLLNQQCLAGLGNIYSDEALWLSRIHPLTPANLLRSHQIEKLTWAIRKSLQRGISLGGSSMRDYLHPDGSKGLYQDHRLVYARQGLSCMRCRTPIQRIKIQGRSSFFCPECQKLLSSRR
ncbi:bifunctional DNA-formamidopyrimidine glycosylase/DNA-(apurinic or apyrimidinic site) lyase [Desulfovulcanus sp.]